MCKMQNLVSSTLAKLVAAPHWPLQIQFPEPQCECVQYIVCNYLQDASWTQLPKWMRRERLRSGHGFAQNKKNMDKSTFKYIKRPHKAEETATIAMGYWTGRYHCTKIESDAFEPRWIMSCDIAGRRSLASLKYIDAMTIVKCAFFSFFCASSWTRFTDQPNASGKQIIKWILKAILNLCNFIQLSSAWFFAAAAAVWCGAHSVAWMYSFAWAMFPHFNAIVVCSVCVDVEMIKYTINARLSAHNCHFSLSTLRPLPPWLHPNAHKVESSEKQIHREIDSNTFTVVSELCGGHLTR